MDKNFGYSTIYKIFKVLSGKEENIKNLNLPKDMTVNDILYFKYAPLTSKDVKRCRYRSFSKLKNVVADNGRSLSWKT